VYKNGLKNAGADEKNTSASVNIFVVAD